MKKKSLGEKFCDKLWEKLTAGCEKGKWRSGKKVDGVFDPQYFLKETIRETAISEAYAKRLLDLGKDDDWYCLNYDHAFNILNNQPNAKIPWFEDEMTLKKARPLYEERADLIDKKFSAGGLSAKEEERLKELDAETDSIESKTHASKAAKKYYDEVEKDLKKLRKTSRLIEKSLARLRAKNSKKNKGAK